MSEAQRTKVELEHTQAAFARVRASFLEAIARTKFDEQVNRERYYMGVQVLDGVLTILIAAAAGADVEEHIEKLKNPPAEAGS